MNAFKKLYHRYKLFKIVDLKRLKKIDSMEEFKLLTNVLISIPLDNPRLLALDQYTITTTMPTALTFCELLEEGVRNYEKEGEFRYNRRLISSAPNRYRMLDWYWRPILGAKLDTGSYLSRINSCNRKLQICLSVDPSGDKRNYINRVIGPFVTNLNAVAAVLETLYT